ncbi:hypothetical protein Tco_0799427 [Tanacetum coccineum]|uniref:Uncharacterized protein n=1 Tax=Tanacetum coccineum TaxID=301880 RepID=A0ABQ4ZQA7_9ASTR
MFICSVPWMALVTRTEVTSKTISVHMCLMYHYSEVTKVSFLFHVVSYPTSIRSVKDLSYTEEPESILDPSGQSHEEQDDPFVKKLFFFFGGTSRGEGSHLGDEESLRTSFLIFLHDLCSNPITLELILSTPYYLRGAAVDCSDSYDVQYSPSDDDVCQRFFILLIELSCIVVRFCQYSVIALLPRLTYGDDDVLAFGAVAFECLQFWDYDRLLYCSGYNRPVSLRGSTVSCLQP